MVLFGEASVQQMNVIMECLDRFCKSSGEKVNTHKSQLFVSANVQKSLAMALCNISGIPLTEDLGRYLGVSFIHDRVTNDLYTSVVERVAARLYGWKMKYLTLAGRQVLTQSVLSAIPLYSMQSTLIPKGICNTIKKMIRKFLWGSNGKKHGCHLVKWDTILLPKENGGLGLRSLHHMNLAFLAKIGWRMMTEKESLWVRVLNLKYVRTEVDVVNFKAKNVASNVWHGIFKAFPVIGASLRKLVLSGTRTCFWSDVWLIDHPLYEDVLIEIDLVESYRLVREYWIDESGWNYDALEDLLPDHILIRLETVLLCDEESRKIVFNGVLSLAVCFRFLPLIMLLSMRIMRSLQEN